MRIGGLFEGYGGLTMGVQAALGGDLAWYSEIEPAAVRLLEHHHPAVPNLGDVTEVDWESVERPDVLTGGFPCQDVSSAGRQAGLKPGTRSGLWAHMACAINVLRPNLVVIENVRGLLSAEAHSDLEPCPWCLGDQRDRPLRALGAVLGDLSVLGYDARWCGLRAADAGAPHARYRVFVAAWPVADTGGVEPERWGVGGVVDGPAGSGEGEGPQREWDRDAVGDGGADVADSDGVGSVRGGSARGWRRGSADDDLGAAADTAGAGPQGRRVSGRAGAPVVGDGASAAADAVCDGREGHEECDERQEAGQRAPLGGDAAGRVLDWGTYEPAVRRWELILGRSAPAPTQTGKRGGQQLSPAFVEWLMGLPAGHVTATPGLSRNEQLKALGNGVVPQQAALAVRHLLAVEVGEVAA